MTATRGEPTIGQRLEEQPSLERSKIREASPKELGYRFLAGAATSVIAGLVTLGFGARVGGILLAFPAILAASLTLIEEQEDSVDAREDARGAVIGGCGLIAFALVAALALTSVAPALALLLAATAWTIVALGGYAGFWWKPGGKSTG
ncbi:MAG: hypothetical protein QOD66_2165 [Solirubrobacteraceae bacterium]|jgi:hypothetical protein|nr:hypothetical protein [Solirubrobacteraceae bacterium]